MNLLQQVAVALNFPPFTGFFHYLYSFGVKTLISSLAKQKAIYSILGYGSFFEGNCVYGVSDIDFVILIDEKYSRSDGVHRDIALVYRQLRRLFPFLADWHETAENLIFLSEYKAGFPLAESLRLRFHRGMLHLLHGSPVPENLSRSSVNLDEVVSEIDTLLRIILMKREIYTSNLLFWKRMFVKLLALVKILNLPELDREMRDLPELKFLSRKDRDLFFQKSQTGTLFRIFFNYSQLLFAEIKKRENPVMLAYQPFSVNGNAKVAAASFPGSKAMDMIAKIPEVEIKELMPPSLYGIMPRMNYLPMDEATPVLHLEHADYDKLRKISKLLVKHGRTSESLFIQTQGFFFLMRKLHTHTDVVPLDPLIFSNLYATTINGAKNFAMPATIYEERKSATEKVFTALANVYKKNDGRIPKLPFPCIYAEDDLLVLRDAFHRMRVYVAFRDNLDLGSTAGLIEFLSEKHPDCREFLTDLLHYYSHLLGENGHHISSNNLYRSLLQFMSKLLKGEPKITIENRLARLGITVGIITRNRAEHLPDLLESLTRQTRPPDEVLIVDNGSTDQTRKVIEQFTGRLPIHYEYLNEPSIPKARNTVIEKAKNEIISFTDDDCIAEPEWLYSVERGFLRAENIGIVGGWVRHEPSREGSVVDAYFERFHSNTT